VFCTFNSGNEDFIWIQDDGHLLAHAAGPVHEDVWNWWVGVHHNIGFAGSPASQHVTSPQHHVPFRMKSFHRTAV
jgi:hypothetical protein